MAGDAVLNQNQINQNQNVNMTPTYMSGNVNAASNAPGYNPPIQPMQPGQPINQPNINMAGNAQNYGNGGYNPGYGGY